MEIINNIEWFFNEPKNAIFRNTHKKITKKQLKTVVFDNLLTENVNFCFPMNDNFTLSETRGLSTPITVEDILTLVHTFYSEPLSQETIDKSFGENIELKREWNDNMIDCYHGNMHQLTNIDLFDSTCTPDFCGIHLIEEGENAGEYFINIGPE